MKKQLKTLGKILAGIIVFIALAGVGSFLGTIGVDDAAEDVMALFHEGRIEEVYRNTATVMQEQYSFEEFKNVMGVGKEYDISKAKKKSWNGRGFSGSQKHISGAFEFTNGEIINLYFWFVKEDGELKLNGITDRKME